MPDIEHRIANLELQFNGLNALVASVFRGGGRSVHIEDAYIDQLELGTIPLGYFGSFVSSTLALATTGLGVTFRDSLSFNSTVNNTVARYIHPSSQNSTALVGHAKNHAYHVSGFIQPPASSVDLTWTLWASKRYLDGSTTHQRMLTFQPSSNADDKEPVSFVFFVDPSDANQPPDTIALTISVSTHGTTGSFVSTGYLSIFRVR